MEYSDDDMLLDWEQARVYLSIRLPCHTSQCSGAMEMALLDQEHAAPKALQGRARCRQTKGIDGTVPARRFPWAVVGKGLSVAAKQGPSVLICVPNRTNGTLLWSRGLGRAAIACTSFSLCALQYAKRTEWTVCGRDVTAFMRCLPFCPSQPPAWWHKDVRRRRHAEAACCVSMLCALLVASVRLAALGCSVSWCTAASRPGGGGELREWRRRRHS
jgi:hypothetical protein